MIDKILTGSIDGGRRIAENGNKKKQRERMNEVGAVYSSGIGRRWTWLLLLLLRRRHLLRRRRRRRRRRRLLRRRRQRRRLLLRRHRQRCCLLLLRRRRRRRRRRIGGRRLVGLGLADGAGQTAPLDAVGHRFGGDLRPFGHLSRQTARLALARLLHLQHVVGHVAARVAHHLHPINQSINQSIDQSTTPPPPPSKEKGGGLVDRLWAPLWCFETKKERKINSSIRSGSMAARGPRTIQQKRHCDSPERCCAGRRRRPR